MQCRKLTLRNFCQHRSREISLSTGLSAIIGDNGSGKSNTLNAVLFALTGDNINSGTKAANITEGAAASDESYVELVFEHSGLEYAVRRNIRPARPTAVLTLPDGSTIDGDQKVTEHITAVLGVDSSVIREIVIVPQAELLGFLSKTPAKRAEQFQRLFGTQAAAAVFEMLGSHIKSLEIPDNAASLEELRQGVAQQQQSLQQWYAALAEAPSDEDIRENVSRLNRQLAAVEAAIGNKQRLAGAVAAAMEAEVVVKSETIRRVDFQSKVRHADDQLQQLRQDCESLSQAVVAIQERARTCSERRSLETSISEQEARLASFLTPVQRPYPASLEAVNFEIEETAAELRKATELVNTFSEGVATCPTCGTPAANLEESVHEARTQVPLLTTHIEALRRTADALRRYEQDIQTKQASAKLTQELIAGTVAKLSALPDVDPPTEDELAVIEEARRRQSLLHEAMSTERTKLRADWLAAADNSQRKIDEANKVLHESNGVIAAIKSQVAEIPADENVARDLRSTLKWWEDTNTKKAAYTGTIAGMENSLAEMQRQLSSAEDRVRQAESLRRWKTHAGDIMGILAKDAAPRMVAQQRLSQLQHSMNELLEEFSADFRVEADEGLSFVAVFNDGRRQPADRLSIGQKVILALSFRLAMNLLLASSVGALYLDEPTAFLDDRHIEGFEPVLNRMRGYAASRGLQVVMVTHERRLSNLFDEVITL